MSRTEQHAAAEPTRARRQLVLLLAAAAVLFPLAARLFAASGARYPCPLHALTGVACPTCGGTRALASLAGGHLARALSWNPLLAGMAIALPLLGLATLAAPRPTDRLLDWLGRRGRTRAGRALMLAALLAQAVSMTLRGG